ncbi:MAG: alpha/beta hydrolase [Candidatus Koribacter versatilis]|uniref:Alpha/beta hydrolase n=1 Tax=Candidatus Korobacter versatilis TaxID=658062 RepID=A0A932A8H3_9BACT|nr:alpha/beta hydrolase [Candidatus Koribacter versatilis]
MPAEIKSFFLAGPAGRLEALLNAGSANATHAALVCHPHPLYGGTVHNKVVYHAMKALSGCGFPVLRFNFRGAGLSEGKHDDGRGEAEDVRVALDWLTQEFHLPLVFAGFSFGAAVGMRVACGDPPVGRIDVRAIIALGMPIAAEGRAYAYDYLAHCATPKLFISGGNDEYGPTAKVKEVVAQAAPPKQLVIVPGVDHFFAGKVKEVQRVIEDWLGTTLHR